MGRKKVTMNLIASRSVRSTTFKKRRSSLLKKARELSSLCGRPVCVAVSNGPNDPSPIVWPSAGAAAQMLSIANSMPEGKHTIKLSRQVVEMQEQLQNLDQENLHLEAENLLDNALSGKSYVAEVASPELAMTLSAILQMRLKEVQDKIDSLAPLSVAPDRVHGTNSLEASMVQPPMTITRSVHWDLWDGEHLAPFLEAGTDSLKNSLPEDGKHLMPILEECMLWDGEHLAPILEAGTNSVENSLPKDGGHMAPITEKCMLWDYEIMSGPFDPFSLVSLPEQHVVEDMPSLFDAPNETGGIFNGLSPKVASSSEWCGTSRGASADVAPIQGGAHGDSLDEKIEAILSSFFEDLDY